MSSQENNPNSVIGALTSPNRSEGNAEPLPVQPPQPTNLQGLLRFAMEATKAEDAPGNTQIPPMDEERRKFLEEALKSLTVNMAEVIQEAITVLTDADKIKAIKVDDQLPSDVKTAFNNLLELIDDIDVANDFYKMGGFAIFPICYSCENDEIRSLTSTVLGECCQNNPYCQQRAMETGLLDVVINLVQNERGEPLVKSLYALSCCCREYEPACRVLVSQGGCGALVALLQAPEIQARTKAAFLIRYLCHNHDEAKETFLKENLVKSITDLIKKGRDETTEHLLSIILALLENLDQRALQQCNDPNLGLKQVLTQHLSHPDLVSDQFTEEKEYCVDVLKHLKDVKIVDNGNTEADR